ncbi:MAG: response regulator, partial [Chloroflexi bacterium]|nr:response regulator [Chloroflexota bacterium]
MRDSGRERSVVLLIEPPRNDHPGLAGSLDFDGYVVWQAESGTEAGQMLAEARRARTEPDVIVLDRA